MDPKDPPPANEDRKTVDPQPPGVDPERRERRPDKPDDGPLGVAARRPARRFAYAGSVTIRTGVGTEEAWSSRLLIIADAWSGVEPIKQALQGTSIHVVRVAESRGEAISFLEDAEVDVIVIRIGLPDSEALDLAREILDRWPGPEIVMVGQADRDVLIEALKAGVKEWVLDFDNGFFLDMRDAIERAARHR